MEENRAASKERMQNSEMLKNSTVRNSMLVINAIKI